MARWKKGFRKIPSKIASEIQNLESQNAKVLAGKLVSRNEVEDGVYEHLNLNLDSLVIGNSWELIPPEGSGLVSKRNSNGWEVVRKDLPKFRKYFYQDIPIYGDGARNGWTTAAIPREVYERDEYPPYLFNIEVRVQEQVPDGRFGVVFSIDEVFATAADGFEEDLLFALNLLQENTGVSGVVGAENPDFVFTSELDWELFPPGDIEAVVDALSTGRRAVSPDVVRERLELFEQFQPTEYLKGLGGNDHYIGAKYADDLVVFENMKYGNALYVLYQNWLEHSRRPRSELLKLKGSQFDRVIHSAGWETKFAVLMQTELQARGIRIRIGRHLRRRRRLN